MREYFCIRYATTSGSTGDGGTDTIGVSDEGCGCSSTTPADNYRGGLLGLLGLGLLARARRRRPTSDR